MWVQLAIAVVMLIVSYAITASMMPKSQNAVAGKLDVPTAEAGSCVPVVFGTVLIRSPNIVDYMDARVVPIMSEGGKK